MKNVVIFASDSKALSSLNSVISECSKEGLRIFAMITQQTQLQHPKFQKENFQILSNVERKNVEYSETLGLHLPFKPDWLIVNRERWDPELSIIREFKHKWKCKVGVVEANAQMMNNAESILEICSKDRFSSFIDVWFDHSHCIRESRRIAGFNGNIEVVGNPKYDLNVEVSEETIKEIKRFYSVDESKEKVLLFSLVNQSRTDINKFFKEYVEKNPDKQFFYKPYPGEPFDAKFRNDYHPNFFLPNCLPILEETHIWPMFHICNHHIGSLSSIFYTSLLLGKKITELREELGTIELYLDTSGVFQQGGPGLENNLGMWMRSFGFTDPKQLRDLLSDEKMENVKNHNQIVWDSLQKPDELLKLFDSFNDKKAGYRIIQYIKNR